MAFLCWQKTAEVIKFGLEKLSLLTKIVAEKGNIATNLW